MADSELMRVVAGTARGLTLVAPAGRATRPTTDRVREAMFNALHSLGVLQDANVLDLFAGSGALGIEALSRGAAHATFADVDPTARHSIEKNLQTVDATGRARVLAQAADRVLADAAANGHRFDVVLLDPPYGFEPWPVLLTAVAAVIADHGVAVVESDSPAQIAVGTGLEVTRSKRYGSTVVTFARPSGAHP